MAYIETNGIKIREKERKWLTPLSLMIALIINGISLCSTVYFAVENRNLQNSLYNFQPFMFSNYTTSTLDSMYCARNDTMVVLFGLVKVDLKVITPHNGMLTINVGTLNFTHINEPSYIGLELLDINNLNFSKHSVFDMGVTPHQYFILRDVINSIEDNILVRLTVILKPDWLPPNATAIGFNLGDLMLEANLFAVRTNQTMTETFSENVYGMFTPT